MRQLTELQIKRLPYPATGSQKHFDPSTPGFGVRCSAKSKSFFVMYGKERRLKTLGKYPQISLKEAREAAKAILLAKPQKTRTTRLPELVTAFLEDCEARLRSNTTRRYRSILKHAPDIPITEAHKSLAKTSHEVMTYKIMFNWACRMELADKNPFHFAKATINHRQRVLSDEEIRLIWNFEDPPFTEIVKLLILTGQRRNQMANIETSWIEDDTINFPSLIMKSKRSHTIPFNLLTAQHLKPLRFNGWGKSKQRLDTATGVTDWVLHDLRRYYSTTMAKLGVPLHITEHLLDHRTSTSGVQSVYMRYGFLPEMRKAVSIFEQHIAKIISA